MSSENVKRIQRRLFEMAKKVTGILSENNIPYMITFGTLLGAVREGGFIPWDDDFDLHLFDDTYDEAIELLRHELSEDMFLEDKKSEPLFFHGWARVKDENSIVKNVLFPQDNVYAHKGINLDLYRLDRVKKSQVMKYINDENFNYITRRKEKGLITNEEYERRLGDLENSRLNEAQVEEDDKIVFGMVSPYKCKYLEVDDIFPLKKYRFEEEWFYGPNNPGKILTDIYGNYMMPPPESDRCSHAGEVVFISGE